MSEVLKTNTTLQSLNLTGDFLEVSNKERSKMNALQTLRTTNTNKQTAALEQKEQEH